MRRPVITAAAFAALATASVACGEPVEGPKLPTVDFTPAAVIEAGPSGLGCTSTSARDDRLCTVRTGSVVEVANAGPGERRIRGGEVFDTGVMQPGGTTTVVLTEVGTIEVRDVTEPEHTLELTVTARNGE
jgi:hypothetical protein